MSERDETRDETATFFGQMAALIVYCLAYLGCVVVAVRQVGWVLGLSVGLVASAVVAAAIAGVAFVVLWPIARFWKAALLIAVFLAMCGRALLSLI